MTSGSSLRCAGHTSSPLSIASSITPPPPTPSPCMMAVSINTPRRLRRPLNLLNTATVSSPLPVFASPSLSLPPPHPPRSLFFSSRMRLVRDWHARGAALAQLPWLLRQQPRVHLLHPDAAWQRHPAASAGLQAGGGRPAQGEVGVGGWGRRRGRRSARVCVRLVNTSFRRSDLNSSHSVLPRSLMAAVIRPVCWGCLQAASCSTPP